MIRIDTKQLLDILATTPDSQNIMLVGRHGIGKSEILKNYFSRRGLRVVTLFLGQMADPGDLIGLPDKEGEQTRFLAPLWWPMDGQPVVLFLDELNRARPELLQTVMDLCLNRTLAGRLLPAGSRVIAAVNEGDAYQLTPLDPALVSRFNVYEFCPTAADWLLYATEQKLDERVVAFLRDEPAWLDGVPGDLQTDHGLDPQPDRRAWTRLAAISVMLPAIGEEQLPLLSGIVGTAAASRLMAHVTGHQNVTGMQVLQDFSAYEWIIRRYPIHVLSLINEGIFQHLELSNPDSVSSPLAAEEAERYAANLKAYVSLLQSTEDREALAHLANLFAGSRYEKAVAFIVTHAPEVYAMLVDYVAKL